MGAFYRCKLSSSFRFNFGRSKFDKIIFEKVRNVFFIIGAVLTPSHILRCQKSWAKLWNSVAMGTFNLCCRSHLSEKRGHRTLNFSIRAFECGHIWEMGFKTTEINCGIFMKFYRKISMWSSRMTFQAFSLLKCVLSLIFNWAPKYRLKLKITLIIKSFL